MTSEFNLIITYDDREQIHIIKFYIIKNETKDYFIKALFNELELEELKHIIKIDPVQTIKHYKKAESWVLDCPKTFFSDENLSTKYWNNVKKIYIKERKKGLLFTPPIILKNKAFIENKKLFNKLKN